MRSPQYEIAMRICFALAFALGGCIVYRDVGTPPGNGGDGGNGSDGPTTPPGSITFRLGHIYEAGIDPCDSGHMYVQTMGDTGAQAFVQVIAQNSMPVPVVPDCSQCFCDDTHVIEGCGSSPPSVVELQFHDHVDWTWNGTTFPLMVDCTAHAMTCQGSSTAEPGPYLARFCFAGSADGVGPGHHVMMPICQDVAFDVPSATGVVEYDQTCFGV